MSSQLRSFRFVDVLQFFHFFYLLGRRIFGLSMAAQPAGAGHFPARDELHFLWLLGLAFYFSDCRFDGDRLYDRLEAGANRRPEKAKEIFTDQLCREPRNLGRLQIL